MSVGEFLAARLAEVEATAHHSGPGLVAWLTYRDDEGQLLYTTVAAGGLGDWDPWCADGKELPEPASVRVVYDPSRVLREVAAIRDLVRTGASLAASSDTPKRITGENMLVNIATIWEDHPDYDAAWRP